MDETIKFGPWEALFDGKTTNGWHWYNNKGIAPVGLPKTACWSLHL